MTFEKTFNSLHSWLQEIKKHAPSNVIIYLVGNKTDLVEKRVVTQYQANELIKKISVKYFETSAKDGTNVERVFNDLLNEIHAQWQ
jgi:Ras-related protein Rab-1A